ncbi:MAG: ATP-binding cassette domain-containing protein [Planctomycetaceae bacterium]|jgi:ABC-2 type transport system ATP-binding protein|nr:ATP-binding cassette domain-containing protein [Planctomycetaceae bacterium]
MLTISHLVKRFGKTTAVDDVSVQFQAGRITGVVGPDGAGKTTLVRLLAGLLKPSKGTVVCFGLDTVKDSAALREILGYMPQRFGLYEDLTVKENLELYAEMRAMDNALRKIRFTELLHFTGLEPFTDRLAGKLSGGMKQKLGLACSMLNTPKVLLLDEPSVGVDPISRKELWKIVKQLAAGETAVVWNTSYLDEAEACDEVLLLHEGRQLFFGKPAELTKQLDGRVFQIRNVPAEERRKQLAKIILEPEILDGTIQGSVLRVVYKKNTLPQTVGANVVSVPPRFEDGFIDILGGTVKTESVFAKRKIKMLAGSPLTGNQLAGSQPVVIAEHLTKRFGDFTAVHNNSFEIKYGEIFGLLGPNGAGKSTTFKMLCGLLKPTEGRGFIAGYNLLKSPGKARSRLGYMAQKFSMYGDLTVRQNLNFFAGIYGLWGFAKRRAVNGMLELFDLGRYASVNTEVLPLGFKQRLSLAAALMHEPDVLFLDEPTSGVDPLTRREFWMHINALAQSGVAVLITTHFMDEAEYCDRIALIYNGETIALGTPDDLKQSADLSNPSLEDAFITLIQRSRKHREP